MFIEDYLGMPRMIFESSLKNYIVNENETNCTIELSGVQTKVYDGVFNALAYFDLSDRKTMTLLIVKVEKPNFKTRLKYKFSRHIIEKDFTGVTNVNKDKDLIIAYVKGNIFSAL